jgi:hypothetical protein
MSECRRSGPGEHVRQLTELNTYINTHINTYMSKCQPGVKEDAVSKSTRPRSTHTHTHTYTHKGDEGQTAQ